MNILTTINKWFNCYLFKNHKWTSPVDEGVPPMVIGNLLKDWRMSMYEHCRMTCKICGCESEPSKRHLRMIQEEEEEDPDLLIK